MNQVDLHVHSSCSDGTCSPSELVRLASASGLSAFALTDHDCTDGIEEALSAAHETGAVEVVPGIEFSTVYEETDVHIVGLDIPYYNEEFQEYICGLRTERKKRNLKMIARMQADGINISEDLMIRLYGDTVWTRAHFARFLTDRGYTEDLSSAFRKYLGENCRYYVPREKVSPFEVCEVIRRFQGIPVLAHPMLYHFSEPALRQLIAQLKGHGLLGMEVYYSSHTQEEETALLGLCREYGLAESGGSDFHGSNKPEIHLGTGRNNLALPYDILRRLRLAAQTTGGNSYDLS